MYVNKPSRGHDYLVHPINVKKEELKSVPSTSQNVRLKQMWNTSYDSEIN